ncbi:hypothetical protein CEXT_228551 [Caerostris extrusa]|uniref:Uncharacterized protein n=1 Tax=Caerostris extrusa TaxID=172846 RepID=A0AAV4XVZ3_CAEEX|nr:hypothetical protein CEXT_228551 [Caerostris extrusa]
MEITKCEYCNTYVTNFEVHNCVKFGDQHRPNYATIPQNSYANLAEDIDLRTAEQMYYATPRSPMNQMNISRQQSILSNVHLPIYCKETTATEMVSQHGVANQYEYNNETSDFLFPDMYPFQANVPNSTQLQLPSEEGEVFINQNLQSFQPSNSAHHPNNSMSIAEQYSQTNYTHRTESCFGTVACDILSKNRSNSGNSRCRNREDGIFNLYGTENPSHFTDHVSLPSTSQVSVQNRESHAAKLCAVNINEDKNTAKNKQGTDFSYGIDNSVPCTSNAIQTQQRNFCKWNNEQQHRTSCMGIFKSILFIENCNACKISITSTVKKSSVNCKEHSPKKF